MSTEAMKPSERSTEESTNATHLVASLLRDPKPAGGSSHTCDEDEHGVSIITLEGNNSGATLEGLPCHQEADGGAPDLEWATLVNSNLQAVNNSIMLGSKYKSHDPGVHMDISEALDELEVHKQHRKHGMLKGKKKKKKKKKKKVSKSSSSESDPHSSGSGDL